MRVFWLGQDCPQDHIVADAAAEFTFQVFEGLAEMLTCLSDGEPDAVVVRCPVTGYAAVEVLELIQRTDDVLPVIFCDPKARTGDVIRLIKLGAHYCLPYGHSADDLTEVLRSAVEDRRTRQLVRLSRVLAGDRWKRFLIGESPAMRNVERIIRLAGPRRGTVLITGETGTGKEMAARALHAASNRSHAPMVAINCSAIPENLLETELFGHTKGAFTGAAGPRVGRFEQAHGGTLLLDEIGDMPLDLQCKLLRVLQEREIQRVGGSEIIKVDVRVIAASNLNLAERVKQGKFREDLYYRLNVVPLHMPPLRERSSDIPALVHHFIHKVCAAEDLPVKRIHREAMDRLCAYSWPGNVRELENAIEMAVVMCDTRDTLFPSDFDLPGSPPLPPPPAFPLLSDGMLPDYGVDLDNLVNHFEQNLVQQALQRANGNKTQAADMLGIPRTTLISKLRAYENARGKHPELIRD